MLRCPNMHTTLFTKKHLVSTKKLWILIHFKNVYVFYTQQPFDYYENDISIIDLIALSQRYIFYTKCPYLSFSENVQSFSEKIVTIPNIQEHTKLKCPQVLSELYMDATAF